MPYLKLNTNVSITPEQAQPLLKALSKVLAQETGKPERYVMVELAGDKAMLLGGNDLPLAYLECKSIGLSVTQTQSLAAALPQALSATLSIPADRVYIEFSPCPAEFWGWNGSTFG